MLTPDLIPSECRSGGDHRLRVITTTTGVLCETFLRDSEAGYILGEIEQPSEFASSLLSKWSEREYFTRDQSVYAHMIAMDWIRNRSECPQTQSSSLRFPSLVMLFSGVSVSRVAPLAVFLMGDGLIKLQFLKSSKSVMVRGGFSHSSSDNFRGKILLDGSWEPGKFSCDEIETRLTEIERSPVQSCLEHARKTKRCSFCQSVLRGESLERGYGPTCAENWNLERMFPDAKCKL